MIWAASFALSFGVDGAIGGVSGAGPNMVCRPRRRWEKSVLDGLAALRGAAADEACT
jgi:hypothetical protein